MAWPACAFASPTTTRDSRLRSRGCSAVPGSAVPCTRPRHARPLPPLPAGSRLRGAERGLSGRGSPAARECVSEVIGRLGQAAPKVAALLEEAEEDLLAFYSFPAPHWSKLRSTDENVKASTRRSRRFSPNRAVARRSVRAPDRLLRRRFDRQPAEPPGFRGRRGLAEVSAQITAVCLPKGPPTSPKHHEPSVWAARRSTERSGLGTSGARPLSPGTSCVVSASDLGHSRGAHGALKDCPRALPGTGRGPVARPARPVPAGRGGRAAREQERHQPSAGARSARRRQVATEPERRAILSR